MRRQRRILGLLAALAEAGIAIPFPTPLQLQREG